jgi:hypothetical protein
VIVALVEIRVGEVEDEFALLHTTTESFSLKAF